MRTRGVILKHSHARHGIAGGAPPARCGKKIRPAHLGALSPGGVSGNAKYHSLTRFRY